MGRADLITWSNTSNEHKRQKTEMLMGPLLSRNLPVPLAIGS